MFQEPKQIKDSGDEAAEACRTKRSKQTIQKSPKAKVAEGIRGLNRSDAGQETTAETEVRDLKLSSREHWSDF